MAGEPVDLIYLDPLFLFLFGVRELCLRFGWLFCVKAN
jgi:hypothetical protein